MDKLTVWSSSALSMALSLPQTGTPAARIHPRQKNGACGVTNPSPAAGPSSTIHWQLLFQVEEVERQGRLRPQLRLSLRFLLGPVGQTQLRSRKLTRLARRIWPNSGSNASASTTNSRSMRNCLSAHEKQPQVHEQARCLHSLACAAGWREPRRYGHRQWRVQLQLNQFGPSPKAARVAAGPQPTNLKL